MRLKYIRSCKFCGNEIRYPNKKALIKAENENKKCRKCKISDFLSFVSAREIARGLNLDSQNSWQLWIRSTNGKESNIPSNPDKFYKDNGWVSYGDWLGNISYKHLRNIQYIDYCSCQKYILDNFPNITNKREWIGTDKSLLPIFIPKRPDVFYKKTGWVNWEEFLDSPLSPRSKGKLLLSFNDAKAYVRNANINSESEYYHHIDINDIKFLPLRPDSKYKELWNGFVDFLGINSLRRSTGEDRIKDILESHKIEFEREKRFDGCKNKNRLPFDFYIGSLNICIEYDGEFHTKAQNHFGGELKFIEIKRNDLIKNKWCEDNGIKLIRISHIDKWRIRKILENQLNLK